MIGRFSDPTCPDGFSFDSTRTTPLKDYPNVKKFCKKDDKSKSKYNLIGLSGDKKATVIYADNGYKNNIRMIGDFVATDSSKVEGELVGNEIYFDSNKWGTNKATPIKLEKGETFGVEIDASGNRLYEGKFKDGKRNGQGTEYVRSGTISIEKYKGEFKDGMRDGQGIEFDDDDKEIYNGKWKGGNRVTGKRSRKRQCRVKRRSYRGKF